MPVIHSGSDDRGPDHRGQAGLGASRYIHVSASPCRRPFDTALSPWVRSRGAATTATIAQAQRPITSRLGLLFSRETPLGFGSLVCWPLVAGLPVSQSEARVPTLCLGRRGVSERSRSLEIHPTQARRGARLPAWWQSQARGHEERRPVPASSTARARVCRLDVGACTSAPHRHQL